MIINATPHAIVLLDDCDAVIQTFSPSGLLPRIVEEDRPSNPIEGFEAISRIYAGLEGLPGVNSDTIYIVSAMVLAAARTIGRSDCCAPDTGSGAVRDGAGRIIGTRRFVR